MQYTTFEVTGGMPYWWSDEIASRKHACSVRRRAAPRGRSRTDISEEWKAHLTSEFKAAQKALKRPARRAKADAWRNLLELEANICSDAFSIDMKELPFEMPDSLAKKVRKKLVGELFPTTGSTWVSQKRCVAMGGSSQYGGAKNCCK